MMVLGALSCLAQNSYTINAQISGLKDGTVIQLVEKSHGDMKPFNTATVRGGKFSFKGVQKDPRGVRMVVKDAYGSYPFILNNSKITLTGNTTVSNENQKASYSFDIVAKGSSLTDLYLKKVSVRDELNKMYEEKNTKYADVWSRYRAARGKKDSLLVKQIEQSEEYKAANDAEANFFKTVEQKYTQVVRDNKDSWWGPFLMVDLWNYFDESSKQYYNILSAAAKNSYYGKMVYKELFPTDYTGKTIPQFKLKDNDGKIVAFAELCKGKKYIILDFWASWCHPCRKEIPNFKNLYAKYAEKGLQIISVSIDKDEAAWKKALNEEKMPWPGFIDRTEVANLYNVRAIPAIFLIDAQGKLISDKLRGETLADKLAELFK
jgi:thiol-disulfide isomerase/thioredoxin